MYVNRRGHTLESYDIYLWNKEVTYTLMKNQKQLEPTAKEVKDLYQDFNMKTFYIGRQMRSAEGKSDVFEKKNEDNEILIWNFPLNEEESSDENVDV